MVFFGSFASAERTTVASKATMPAMASTSGEPTLESAAVSRED
jgi:hypothetical protein